jgi:Autographiviridae endonuclease VII
MTSGLISPPPIGVSRTRGAFRLSGRILQRKARPVCTPDEACTSPFAADPGTLDKILASQAAKKEEREQRRRLKMQTDPVYAEKVRAANREYQRKKRFKEVYGITIEEYDAMFARQGGACGICRVTGQKLVVDHCHITGKIGLLRCNKCNIALGFCRDDPNIVRALADYLDAYSAHSSHCRKHPDAIPKRRRPACKRVTTAIRAPA